MVLAPIALFTEILLGLRFRVLIPARTTVIGTVAIFSIGTALSNELWLALLTMIVALTALQIGYISGTNIRYVILTMRVAKDYAIRLEQRPVR